MNKELSAVTGANGHLGYNLVRLLLSKGEQVRATVRNLKNSTPLHDLGCEVAQADLMRKETLLSALNGVKNLYAVGAAFKMWSKYPKAEIYDNNVVGTQNLFEAAAACGVENIVYVSSVAALDFSRLPAKEENGYNKDRRNWYYNSKNDSDKLALELGKKYNIRTVLVLPSGMIGGVSHQLNYSSKLVLQILNGEIPVDTNITMNWIDVNDVAEGMHNAMLKGANLQRYILANEKHTSIQESVKIAAEHFPQLKLKMPVKIPKAILYFLAGLMEAASKITGREPLLQRHFIKMFYGLNMDFDISKARTELGFNPKPSKVALIETIKYLKEDWNKKQTA